MALLADKFESACVLKGTHQFQPVVVVLGFVELQAQLSDRLGVQMEGTVPETAVVSKQLEAGPFLRGRAESLFGLSIFPSMIKINIMKEIDVVDLSRLKGNVGLTIDTDGGVNFRLISFHVAA